MREIEIRCLNNERELKKLKELQSKTNAPEVYRHYPHHNEWLDKLFDDVKTNKKQVFGAYVGDRLVGDIIIKNTETDTLEIKNIYVDKSWRKKGIGKKLLKYVENYGIKNGYKFIEVEVPYNEKECINFFLKNRYNVKVVSLSKYNKNENIAILYKKLF